MTRIWREQMQPVYGYRAAFHINGFPAGVSLLVPFGRQTATWLALSLLASRARERPKYPYPFYLSDFTDWYSHPIDYTVLSRWRNSPCRDKAYGVPETTHTRGTACTSQRVQWFGRGRAVEQFQLHGELKMSGQSVVCESPVYSVDVFAELLRQYCDKSHPAAESLEPVATAEVDFARQRRIEL